MNTLMPVLEKLRSICPPKFSRYLTISPKKRRSEVQLEFRWR
jgi:hypothetical protein